MLFVMLFNSQFSQVTAAWIAALVAPILMVMAHFPNRELNLVSPGINGFFTGFTKFLSSWVVLNGLRDSVGGSLVLWCGRTESCISILISQERKKAIKARTRVYPVPAELTVDGLGYRWRMPLISTLTNARSLFLRVFFLLGFKLNITF